MNRPSPRHLANQLGEALHYASGARCRELDFGAATAPPDPHSLSRRPDAATAVITPLLGKRLQVDILAPTFGKEI